jgi:hypothetical protein
MANRKNILQQHVTNSAMQEEVKDFKIWEDWISAPTVVQAEMGIIYTNQGQTLRWNAEETLKTKHRIHIFNWMAWSIQKTHRA